MPVCDHAKFDLPLVVRDAKIERLKHQTSAAYDLARFWRGRENPTAATNQLVKVDECLDELLALGVGR